MTVSIPLPYGAVLRVAVADAGVDELLARVAECLGDLRPAWSEVATLYRRSFAANFRAGGRPRWAPLTGGTIYGKATLALRNGLPYATMRGRARVRRLEQVKASGGRPARSVANILIATGAYRDSWTAKGALHVERVSKAGLETGSKHPLAPIHEFGTGVHGSKGMPFEIKPVKAKSLRWFGPHGPVFAKRVLNPGVPARPVGILQDEDLDATADAIARYVLGAP